MNSRKLIILCSLFIIYLYGCQNADEKNAALIRQLNPTVNLSLILRLTSAACNFSKETKNFSVLIL